jgi:uncharacterized protein (TIGR03435 family)
MDMLRALLIDRFQLRTHKETRSLPVYALITAKGGPKLGSQFHALKDGESVPDSKLGLLVFRGTVKQFARMIGAAATSGRIAPGPGQAPLTPPDPLPVVDLTEITGSYVITVDLRQINDWIEVVEPQLGLNLAPRRIATEVIVIDNAVKPEAN